MSDAWDQAKEIVDQHAASGGIFVKLVNDGDKVSGCFVGSPYIREVVWTGERYEPFDEDDSKQKGKRSTLRLAINFYVPAENTMKVIELSSSAIKDVFKLRDKYGFDSSLFEIERNGGPGDPKTKYRILPDGPITAGMRADMADLEVFDLHAVISGDGGDEQDDEPSTPRREAAAGAVDALTADKLTTGLRALPREAVTAFLKKFGIARIRELKARDTKAAIAFVQSLSQQPEDPASDVEVDPFA
jgi:hypothetical protein